MFEHLRDPLLCEWLEKAIVRHVIASLGEQKGRHNIGNCFIDKAVLSMLVDLLTGWGSW